MKATFNYIWVVLLLLGLSAEAQILDDSTKEIYTHKTTKYRLEQNLITNQGFELSDTSLVNFSQNSDFLYQGNRWYQNLGVFGTAARPLYFSLPQVVGLRYGSNAYDYLLPGHEAVRYYNTLSPFTSIQYVQGGKKRQMMRAFFSQNVTSRWNLTGQYQRFTALRTISVTQSEQRLNDHHSLYVSTNYTSKNNRLLVWGYYQHANQLSYETGGVLPGINDTQDSLFTPDIENANLNLDARNRELRNNGYAGLKWKPFGNALFVRTAHARTKQINRYTDYLPNVNFYGGNLYFQTKSFGESDGKADTLFNERIYRLWENTLFVGIEDSLFHLSVFTKRRSTLYFSNLYTSIGTKLENIFGAQASGNLWKGKITGLAEYLNSDQWNVQGLWSGYGLEVQTRWYSYNPSIMQMEFVSKNLVYRTNFEPTRSFHLSVSQTVKLKKWQFVPEYEQYIVSKGIAFNSTYIPYQTSGASVFHYARIAVNGQLGKVFFTQNQFVKVFQNGPQISQMPGLAYHSAHWVDLVRKKRGYGVQLGINLDWRSDIQSESYQPLTGQWYLQNGFSIRPYFVCDVFAHIRIQRARVYLKVHNANQGVGSPGYFSAPYYPGQRRLFELGLVWTFYD